MNGTKNILLKVCTKTGVQNYDQNSSGKSHHGAARNLLKFWKIPSSSLVVNLAERFVSTDPVGSAHL
ncbi:hypothetical protein TNCV_2531581 [Trichonephila clavipes]|nr:hypothetical protein TNCV_1612081 [Trichonephila clavipes]GFU39910.1 hypothetical protein TNCV_2531581 [Trichonephila clavipes]